MLGIFACPNEPGLFGHNKETTMTHPSFTRCQAVVSAAGSTAKTVRGVAKFLRENPSARRNLVRGPRPLTATAWKLQEKARKAVSEAKRARTDKPFRRRYLAGLNRREARAIACDGTIEAVMDYYHSSAIDTRRKELAECARLRSLVTGKKCEPVTEPTFGCRLSVDSETAKRHGVKLIMRGKDASVISTKSPSHLVHHDGETEWKNGKAVKYTRATNNNHVRSSAVIAGPQELHYVCHETRYKVLLPVGYTWGIDGNGLRAVMTGSTADDYHPNAADLIRECCVPGHIVHKITTNRKTRQRYAAEHAAELAQIAGVFVCLADSLRAGNCRQGTIVFAERHGLDIRKHYAAPDLLAQANGDAGRVRIAITAARIRHDRENAQGFCNFADHTV